MAAVAAGVEVTLWDGLGELPHFRPDREGDEHVASLRQAIATSDALLIATPEYAGGMPGVLKNALDWLVGSGELYGKPVVVVSAAPSAERGHHARRWVSEVVAMQGGIVRDSFSVAISGPQKAPSIAAAAPSAMQRALRAYRGQVSHSS